MAHNRCVIIGLCGDSTKHNLLRVKWAAGLVLLVLVIGAPARADDSGASRATVRGTISAGGFAQRAKSLPVFKNRAFCGPTVRDETLLIGAGGGLKNAAVILRPLGKIGVEPHPLVLDNQRCAFVPHVQIAVVGSELLLKNSDPILHTVHARAGSETLFNVGLPRWRQVVKQLDRPGVIRINCDVLHTWMSAAIVVTNTPYFALTDEHGNFAIESVPAGSYEVEVWHERLGRKNARVLVAGDAPISLDVVYALQ
jgi:hypothetical protein